MKIIITAVALVFLAVSSITWASPVNINKATAEQIADSLNGVGMVKAQAIVEYRKLNGSYESAKDIIEVKGIGESTYQKNKKDILIK